jgi:hypothetical protein
MAIEPTQSLFRAGNAKGYRLAHSGLVIGSPVPSFPAGRWNKGKYAARSETAVREADILRVDFPCGAFRWRVTTVSGQRVHVRTLLNHTADSIDREYLAYLMRIGRVRRDRPDELAEIMAGS